MAGVGLYVPMPERKQSVYIVDDFLKGQQLVIFTDTKEEMAVYLAELRQKIDEAIEGFRA